MNLVVILSTVVIFFLSRLRALCKAGSVGIVQNTLVDLYSAIAATIHATPPTAQRRQAPTNAVPHSLPEPLKRWGYRYWEDIWYSAAGLVRQVSRDRGGCVGWSAKEESLSKAPHLKGGGHVFLSGRYYNRRQLLRDTNLALRLASTLMFQRTHVEDRTRIGRNTQ